MNFEFQWENIRFVPILHGKLEFALEVRRQFEQFQPDCIAVEYPPTLEEKILEGVSRLPYLSVAYYYEEECGGFVYLLIEPTDAQVEAIRLAVANGIPVHFIDRDTEEYPSDMTPMPDPYAIHKIGYEKYCRAYLKFSTDCSPSDQDILRERTMAYNLTRLSREADRVLFVGGLYHFPRIIKYLNGPQVQVIGRSKRDGVKLGHLHADSSRELLSEMPYLSSLYEEIRDSEKVLALDRLEVQAEVIKKAREQHWKNSREELTVSQLRILSKFARNYALLTGRLVPNFYQLIVASRGAVDDNFAYEVWEIGSEYRWQTENPGIPVLRLTGEDLFLDEKRIRFHRRLKRMRRRLVSVPVRKRGNRKDREKWREEFFGLSICSYPPEDVVVEGYGKYLQKKAMEIKTEDQSSVEPFISSMLDGIDIRQTIREWGSGRIYVKEERPVRGKVGSVVVIFDPDLPNEKGQEYYPWCVTWLGEHDQESDMAFYSTPAGEVMEGPGISKCIYGGFMLTYPPLRVYDIWKDPYFDVARNKPERLLFAAIDYSMERNVVYVAPTPPSGWAQSFAARLGKKIIYLPIGIFSPVTIRRIREFHVLDGHHVRKYAHQYISNKRIG